MSIIAILVFIAMMGVRIYLTTIYALPILAGLAAYALLKQIHASAPTIAIVSIAAGLAAFATARAGASARSNIVRLATLAMIAAPAGYAAYCATMQLARLLSDSADWWTVLAFLAALVVAGLTIDIVGRQRPVATTSLTLHRIETTATPDAADTVEIPPAFRHRARLRLA